MSTPWQEGYVDVGDGIRLWYREAGTGSPLVFIHGWSLDSSYWLQAAEGFVATHRVILYDSRGNGRSTGAGRPYQFRQLAADLRALLTALGATNSVLAGHSMGGDTALQFELDDPGACRGAILIDAPGVWNFWVGWPGYVILLLGWLAARLTFVAPPQRLAIPLLRFLFWSPAFQRAHSQAVDRWKQQALAASMPQMVSSMRALAARQNLKGRLPSLQMPTLILRGSRDRIVTQHQADIYQQGIPGATLQLIEGAGHMSANEQPLAVAACIRAFVASLRR